MNPAANNRAVPCPLCDALRHEMTAIECFVLGAAVAVPPSSPSFSNELPSSLHTRMCESHRTAYTLAQLLVAQKLARTERVPE